VRADNVPPKDLTTTIIALYGAVLATFVFVWDVHKWLADRGKLKVRCFIARPFEGEGFQSALVPAAATDAKDCLLCLAFRIVNTGTRSILVTQAGGRHRKWTGWSFNSWEFGTPDANLPKKLEPTEDLIAKNYDFLALGKITSLFALDSVGQRHYAPPNEVRDVRRVIRAIRKQANG
jgi:hypothetical protein